MTPTDPRHRLPSSNSSRKITGVLVREQYIVVADTAEELANDKTPPDVD